MEALPSLPALAAAVAADLVLRAAARVREWARRRLRRVRSKRRRASAVELRLDHHVRSRSATGAEFERTFAMVARLDRSTFLDESWLGKAIEGGLDGGSLHVPESHNEAT